MPTTTNYGWTTPADTDLVKDGASAIRTLGTAIDTTVFNNASAAIAKTIVDAKGDIIAATAADTVSRLAVGANNTVLTADSSTATGLKWAAPASGAAVLINRTTFTAAATTTIDNLFSDTYENYRLEMYFITSSSSLEPRIKFRYGTTTHSANYNYGFEGTSVAGSASNVFNGSGNTQFSLEQTSTGSNSILNLLITRPASSGQLFANGFFNSPFKGITYCGGLQVASSQAWSGIELTTSSGTITGAITIYGLVKA